MEKSLSNELPSDALTALQCRAIRSKSCNTMKFGHLYFTIRSGWNSCHVPVRDVINRSPELMQRLKTNCFGENDTYDVFSHFTESHSPHTNPNPVMTLKGQFGHKTCFSFFLLHFIFLCSLPPYPSFIPPHAFADWFIWPGWRQYHSERRVEVEAERCRWRHYFPCQFSRAVLKWI